MNVPGKQFNKDLILSWLMHHLPMETRGKLIEELPAAYADVFQCDAFVVVRKDELPDTFKRTLLRETRVVIDVSPGAPQGMTQP
jgi:hypothetical protein